MQPNKSFQPMPTVTYRSELPNTMQRFGEKLRTLRHRHDITQMRLAAEFGFSTNTYIGLIEHGKKQPSLTFVIRIADLFDVSIDQLLRDYLELPPPELTRWTGVTENTT